MRLTAAIALAILVGTASAEDSLLVANRLDQVYLKDGKVLTGTLLAHGPGGVIIVVEEAERHIPPEELATDENGRWRIKLGSEPGLTRYKTVVGGDTVETKGQIVVQGKMSEEESAAVQVGAGWDAAEEDPNKKPAFYASGRPPAKRKKKAKQEEKKIPKFYASGLPPVSEKKKRPGKKEGQAGQAGTSGAEDPKRAGGDSIRDALIQELLKRYGGGK